MKKLSPVRKLCVLWHDRSLSALSPNKSLLPTSPCFPFASILPCRNSLLGLWYISDSATKLFPLPKPSLYRIQIA
jgi:hypothetical protein